jgi:competence protein ComEC
VSDRWCVALAVAAFAGGLAAVDGHLPAMPLWPGPAVLALGCLLASLGCLRPEVLFLGLALLAAALGQRSVAGLDAPLATGPVHAEVTLVSDPDPDDRGGVTADVRLDGRRLRATAHGAAAGALDDRLAGERVTVIGRVGEARAADAWLRPRHIAGRLAVETVTAWRPGGLPTRLGNGLRRTLSEGATALPERQRSLLAGLTLGDDRDQPADMTDAFRAAGLTHLLAVSGQNVAFVMVVAAPLLTRLRFGPRLAATLGVLAMFALVTRAEPSVVRATAMASAAAVGAAAGRPASSVRTMSLGVGAIVLVDPLLVTSLGFRLSVAGAAGIVVGAARLERLLPGPRWLAAPLAVTVSAQAAVSPLLVAAFGSVPLASLPANTLAAPAAGPIMVWGLTGGLVAGVAGGPVAEILHLPTRALLAWLELVAGAAVRWPLGDLRPGHLVGLAGAAALLGLAGRMAPASVAGVDGLAASSRAAGAAPDAMGPVTGAASAGRDVVHPAGGRARSGARGVRARARQGMLAGGGCLLAAVLVAALVPGPAGGTLLDEPLGVGASLWRSGGATVVVLDGRARDDAVLGALRRHDVDRVDVLVVRTTSRAAADVVAMLRRRWPASAVLVPDPQGLSPHDRPAVIEGGVAPPAGTVLDLGGLRLTVAGNTAGRLEVGIAPRGPPHRWRTVGAAADVSSAVVPAPQPPPVPCAGPTLAIGDDVVDLGARILVAGVVPPPRFGRENEVVATAAAVAATGADLVDVSLPPRLLGPVATAGRAPVAARVATVDEAVAARRAGAAVVMVPVALLTELPEDVLREGPGDRAAAVVALVSDVADVRAARRAADDRGVPLGYDATLWAGPEAIAHESVALAEGCRLLRTTDARRSRRVAEVVSAILGARRPADERPHHDDREAGR